MRKYAFCLAIILLCSINTFSLSASPPSNADIDEVSQDDGIIRAYYFPLTTYLHEALQSIAEGDTASAKDEMARMEDYLGTPETITHELRARGIDDVPVVTHYTAFNAALNVTYELTVTTGEMITTLDTLSRAPSEEGVREAERHLETLEGLHGSLIEKVSTLDTLGYDVTEVSQDTDIIASRIESYRSETEHCKELLGYETTHLTIRATSNLDELSRTITIQGSFIHEGMPVPDALVTITADGTELEAYTNEEGRYETTYHIDDSMTGTTVTFHAFATFQGKSFTATTSLEILIPTVITISDVTTEAENDGLVTVQATGELKDVFGTPIEDVQVTVHIAGNEQTATTSSTGPFSATLSVSSGQEVDIYATFTPEDGSPLMASESTVRTVWAGSVATSGATPLHLYLLAFLGIVGMGYLVWRGLKGSDTKRPATTETPASRKITNDYISQELDIIRHISNASEAVRVAYSLLIDYLESRGLVKRLPHMTHRDIARTLRMHPELENEIATITETFEQARYANRPPSSSQMSSYLSAVASIVRKTGGKV
jgi:hypothetical protein